jgi:hypothetical protein
MGQQCERMDRTYGHANLEDLNAMTVLPRKTACAGHAWGVEDYHTATQAWTTICATLLVTSCRAQRPKEPSR